MRTIVISLIATGLLTGCSVYKKYDRPDIVTEGLYMSLNGNSDTISIASIPWQDMFTDPKLQDLIETGLDRNTDLNIA